MTVDDAKEKALDAARTRGNQLDEAVEKVGAAIEDKIAPTADKVTAKFDEVAGGPPGSKND